MDSPIKANSANITKGSAIGRILTGTAPIATTAGGAGRGTDAGGGRSVARHQVAPRLERTKTDASPMVGVERSHGSVRLDDAGMRAGRDGDEGAGRFNHDVARSDQPPQ